MHGEGILEILLHLLIILHEMLPPYVVTIGDGVVLIMKIHPSVEVLLHPAVDDQLDLLDCLAEGVILSHHFVAGLEFVGLIELDGLAAVWI